MKKIMPFWFLLICLTGFSKYPNRLEIMTVVFIGSGIFLLLGFGVCKIMDDYEFTRKKNSLKNIIGFCLSALVILYGYYLLNIVIVSLFEKRLVWNILSTERGKGYIIIDIALLIVVIGYCGIFYRRHKRWPKPDEM